MFTNNLLNKIKQIAVKQKTVLIVTAFFVLLFVFLETFLRSQYSRIRTDSDKNIFAGYKVDPVCGWKNKMGKWDKWKDYKCEITFHADGTRATSRKKRTNKEHVVLVGGSITQGHGLSDEDTFAWRLQLRYPAIDFYNYGTAAYGSYQSYLMLKEVLKRDDPPLFVFYGFIPHHAERNIASSAWLQYLFFINSRDFSLPYCTIDKEGNLIEKRIYSSYGMPLKIMEFLNLKIRGFIARQREKHAREVTEKLLLKMRDLCKDRGTKLAVLLYHGYLDKGLSVYKDFLEKNNIDIVDCPVKNKDWKKMGRTEFTGHPNAYLNLYWASYISNYIEKSK